MNAIRIRTTLSSDTLHIPELSTMLGKNVEIIILEETTVPSGPPDWDAFARLAEDIRNGGYDFDAWAQQRQHDILHANDHVP